MYANIVVTHLKERMPHFFPGITEFPDLIVKDRANVA
jgi:hypothetical protein